MCKLHTERSSSCINHLILPDINFKPERFFPSLLCVSELGAAASVCGVRDRGGLDSPVRRVTWSRRCCTCRSQGAEKWALSLSWHPLASGGKWQTAAACRLFLARHVVSRCRRFVNESRLIKRPPQPELWMSASQSLCIPTCLCLVCWCSVTPLVRTGLKMKGCS